MTWELHRFREMTLRPRACVRCGLPPEHECHSDDAPVIDISSAINRRAERIYANVPPPKAA